VGISFQLKEKEIRGYWFIKQKAEIDYNPDPTSYMGFHSNSWQDVEAVAPA